MIYAERASALRSALAADGYLLEVAKAGAGRIAVTISATPDACAGCLVPKDMMRAILARELGVDPALIDLAYPVG